MPSSILSCLMRSKSRTFLGVLVFFFKTLFFISNFLHLAISFLLLVHVRFLFCFSFTFVCLNSFYILLPNNTLLLSGSTPFFTSSFIPFTIPLHTGSNLKCMLLEQRPIAQMHRLLSAILLRCVCLLFIYSLPFSLSGSCQ